MSEFNDILDSRSQLVWEIEYTGTKYVDRMRFIPEKYHESLMLQQLMHEKSRILGEFLSNVDGLADLISPYKVGEDYIDDLASLIGLTLIKDENTNITDERALLVEVVNWYKLKGTYEGIRAISRMNNLSAEIYDLYCPNSSSSYNDFSTYVSPADGWFVGTYEGENPPDIPAGYIKTPHFIYAINLDRIYGSVDDFSEYLWKDVLARRVTRLMEEMRPINTVPHKRLNLNPECVLDGLEQVVSGDIRTRVLGDWSNDRLFLDMYTEGSVEKIGGDLVIDDGGDQVVADVPLWYFDESPTPRYLDWAGDNLLVAGWILGTGHKSRNILIENFSASTATPLAGHAPDYVEGATTWVDSSSAWEFLDGELYPVEGGYDQGSELQLAERASVIKYSTYVSNSYSCFLFRKSGGFSLGVELAWVGHWRFQMTQPSGYGPIMDWTGGSIGWHDVEIHDNGEVVSVWVDGILMVDSYAITQCNSYYGIGFTRPSYTTTTKFKDITVDYLRHVESTFTLDTPLESPFVGTFDAIDIQPTYVDYIFTVPRAAVQAGISELAFYLGDAIRLGCVFPDIDKTDDYELRVRVRVYSE
jgi:hypothetical protein